MQKIKLIYIISIVMTILSLCSFAAGLTLYVKNIIPSILMWVSLPIFIISFLVAIVVYFSNTEFVCPHCGNIFQPKTTESVMAVHSFTKRRLKCPHCGKTGWCKEQFKKY